MGKSLKDFDTIKGAILTTKLKLPYYTLSENEYNKKVLERKKEIIDNLEKELKALEIIKEYLYIDDTNTLRLKNGLYINLVGIIFLNQDVIDLLKEVLA